MTDHNVFKSCYKNSPLHWTKWFFFSMVQAFPLEHSSVDSVLLQFEDFFNKVWQSWVWRYTLAQM